MAAYIFITCFALAVLPTVHHSMTFGEWARNNCLVFILPAIVALLISISSSRREKGGEGMKIALGFIGTLAVAAGLYNAVAIINFAAKNPSAQGPGPSIFGVVIPLIVGITMMILPLSYKKTKIRR